MQAKTGDLFSDAVKLVSDVAATSLRLVLLRLQHSQPTMFYHSQQLSVPRTKLQ